MSELLDHFIANTETRLIRIEDKISDLQEFKVEMLWSSKQTALIVSGILGFFSMVASGVLTYFITTHFNK